MPRPLTKTARDGRLYQRDPWIESAITALSALPPSALVERARNSGADTADFVPSECLVYFIREAWRRRDKSTTTDLVGVLFTRCERILKRKIPDRDVPNGEHVRQNILGDLGLLLAQDNAKLDYYECRFNRAFKSLYIGHARKEFDAVNELSPGPAEANDEGTVDDGLIEKLSGALSNADNSDHGLVETGEAIFREDAVRALRALPDNERRAFVLIYGFGYKEESDDPEEVTAATLCGVTGRTIRNRLASAKTKLSRLKEE
jgi:DNA-directed RNA polymerase specialized sigma24 family protein